jgi:hypothetical protein
MSDLSRSCRAWDERITATASAVLLQQKSNEVDVTGKKESYGGTQNKDVRKIETEIRGVVV